MVCLKHCTFKMKNGFKSTRHPIKQNRKKWIIVSIYLDAGTLEKPEFNWRSDLPVYFGVEKTLGVFSGSLDVVVLFIFVQRILEYFIPITSVTNSRTVFICYLWQKTRWFRKKLDSVRQDLALLQLLLWYRTTVCNHWNKLKTVVRMRSLRIPVLSLMPLHPHLIISLNTLLTFSCPFPFSTAFLETCVCSISSQNFASW